ncbi:MAG: hypothetical protein H7288_13650 [Kineosporiaceae bacterium]|nr:hypothetical protein [Aeromicrobium sp.]
MSKFRKMVLLAVTGVVLALPAGASAAVNQYVSGLMGPMTSLQTHDGYIYRVNNGVSKPYAPSWRLKFFNSAGGQYAEQWASSTGFTITYPAGWAPIGAVSQCSNFDQFSYYSVSCWTVY